MSRYAVSFGFPDERESHTVLAEDRSAAVTEIARFFAGGSAATNLNDVSVDIYCEAYEAKADLDPLQDILLEDGVFSRVAHVYRAGNQLIVDGDVHIAALKAELPIDFDVTRRPFESAFGTVKPFDGDSPPSAADYTVEFNVAVPVANAGEYLESQGYQRLSDHEFGDGTFAVRLREAGGSRTKCAVTPATVPEWRGREHTRKLFEEMSTEVESAIASKSVDSPRSDADLPALRAMPIEVWKDVFAPKGDLWSSIMARHARDLAVTQAVERIAEQRGDVLSYWLGEGIGIVVKGDAKPSDFPATIGPKDGWTRRVSVFCNGQPFGSNMWEGDPVLEASGPSITTPATRRPPARPGRGQALA